MRARTEQILSCPAASALRPLRRTRTLGRALVALLSLLLAPLAWAATPVASPPAGTELIMFDDPACHWCRRWDREIGTIYPRSEEGRRAPLRRIDISEARRAGLTLAQPVNATPTFVLVTNGREIGRITGYPGEDFFWPMLGRLLERLGPAPGAPLPPPLEHRAAVPAKPPAPI